MLKGAGARAGRKRKAETLKTERRWREGGQEEKAAGWKLRKWEGTGFNFSFSAFRRVAASRRAAARMN